MDFDGPQDQQEEEEEEEEGETNLQRPMATGGGGDSSPTPPNRRTTASGATKYRECLKNQALGLGVYAVDGCREFMPAGEEGTLDALKCAACNCHRNFHRKEAAAQPEGMIDHHHQLTSPYYCGSGPGGYLAVAPHHPRLALPCSTTSREDQDDGSNGNPNNNASGMRKRFRTKFTQEQKDKMLGFSESVGWRIQKQDEEMVRKLCEEINVKRHVLKVWMHNNKHTLGKK